MEWVLDPLMKDPDRLKLNEKRDCTVRAWSYVFNAPYAVSHRFLALVGREKYRGMDEIKIAKAFSLCKRIKWRKGPYSDTNRVSLKTFCSKHPVGRFFVSVRGHAFAVIDGKIHDTVELAGPTRQVVGAWRVYLEDE